MTSELKMTKRVGITIPRNLMPHMTLRGFSVMDTFAVVGAALVVVIAVVGPWLAPADTYRSSISEALHAPSAAHWLGTDDQGRDVLWRTISGARESLASSVVIVVGYSIIGTLIAIVAVAGGKWADEILMRITDIGFALPSLVIALGIAAALGPSLSSSIAALLATGWPYTARLLRGIMSQTMTSPFVEGATVLGVGRARLMIRHVLPNSLDVLTVKWAGDIGYTVLVLAGLSFIGVGAQPPSAEWGSAVAAGRGFLTTAPWVAIVPGAAIAFTAVVFGLLGEMLQRRISLRGDQA